MSWKDKIPGSFGMVDKLFAIHPNDAERAVKMLANAIEEGVGWAEYIKEIESWLKSKGCSQAHIDEQMTAVRDLRNYFSYD